jgi:hypothetical protein
MRHAGRGPLAAVSVLVVHHAIIRHSKAGLGLSCREKKEEEQQQAQMEIDFKSWGYASGYVQGGRLAMMWVTGQQVGYNLTCIHVP